eukprot:5863033-Amphidinium_carterae.1
MKTRGSDKTSGFVCCESHPILLIVSKGFRSSSSEPHHAVYCKIVSVQSQYVLHLVLQRNVRQIIQVP